jgi:DNA-binding response OmpR family regulator
VDRLLIIDDDAETLKIWRDYFESCGYEVFTAADTASGITMAQRMRPDGILLDVRFEREGDEAGFLACRKLREFHLGPILMLSAHKVDPIEKVQGLEFGATGYLEKTISLRELEGWVRAQLKGFAQPVHRVGPRGDIEVDTRQREVRKSGKRLSLTQTEYRLLAFLCAHRGEPQSKSDLLDLLYSDDAEASESRLTSHIYNLRRQVENNPSKPEVILTVHGFGYRVV